jgi:hypothetical protein
MLVDLSDYLPFLPHLSIVTVVGLIIVAVSVLLFLLSRVRELLLIGGIAAIYAFAPVLMMMRHQY